ncbi:hypothetical protein IPJ91_02820 [bacterium]|nr:MAG: hypothetical protein IPJ91_02820 [bacterium]
MKTKVKISKTWSLFIGSLLIVILVSTGVQMFLDMSSKTIVTKEIKKMDPELRTDILKIYDGNADLLKSNF